MADRIVKVFKVYPDSHDITPVTPAYGYVTKGRIRIRNSVVIPGLSQALIEIGLVYDLPPNVTGEFTWDVPIADTWWVTALSTDQGIMLYNPSPNPVDINRGTVIGAMGFDFVDGASVGGGIILANVAYDADVQHAPNDGYTRIDN